MDGDIVIDALKGEEHIIQPCSYIREGYVFKWWVDQDGNILNPGDKIIPLKETFLSAEWDDGQYFIDSDISGVGNITKTPDKEFYSYNEAVTVKAVPGEHYEFIEWKHSSETSDTLELKMTRNITVYPVFEKVKFTVTFKNGDDILSTQTIGYGEDAVLPETPTREGWTFDSWKIVDNELIDEPWKNVQSNITISARFRKEVEERTSIYGSFTSTGTTVIFYAGESLTVTSTGTHSNLIGRYVSLDNSKIWSNSNTYVNDGVTRTVQVTAGYRYRLATPSKQHTTTGPGTYETVNVIHKTEYTY